MMSLMTPRSESRAMRISDGSAKFLVVLAAVICAALPAHASRVRSVNLEEMTQRAAIIFSGRLSQIRVVRDPMLDRDVTLLTFNVSRAVKGHPGRTVTVKMLGQLEDAGNTTTLAHYLELLSAAGLMVGLRKFGRKPVRQRASSPKLQVLNTALMTAPWNLGFAIARRDRELWGRLVETSVGAHLVNGTRGSPIEVFYWRERSREVDFVLRRGKTIVAIEVKSARRKVQPSGLRFFGDAFPSSKKLLVGGDGIPLEEFLTTPPSRWLQR